MRENEKRKYYISLYADFFFRALGLCAGVSEWSKEAGLGPAAIGLRGFESHPPHH